ncbi:hypothetical protein CPB84DRAFT_1848652 [Gymnopilus junonius]|uniref:Uncharacterized protein n=1 Tax=Gymnopilus junonius TaxID=109634 RepID=A0A9P5TKJ1_GYMJU|nr:hypothetical protein CPB84DRAFT_1848652 [Gymnopilus junonius]
MTSSGYDYETGQGYPGARQQGQNMSAGGGMTQPGYDGNGILNQGQYAHGMFGPGHDTNYSSNTTGPIATGIPTSNVIGHGNHTSGGGGSKLTGKIESALGELIGSNALKNKGLKKQQEANASKVQSTELAEAERLEREALMRRERAVAHGAHPANSQLGAGNTAQGTHCNYN